MTSPALFLKRHRRIALDTNVFIYQLENDARYVESTTQVFDWIGRDGNSAVASTITMTELLVQPYRLGDEDRVNQLFALATTIPNLSWVAPDLLIADGAARFRARHKLATPDALIAATAVAAGATALVTDDIALKRVEAIEVAVLTSAA
ncbi:MAG: type II toxin-antitoxin system VapC family toxin [Acidobacteriota bacterium]